MKKFILSLLVAGLVAPAFAAQPTTAPAAGSSKEEPMKQDEGKKDEGMKKEHKEKKHKEHKMKEHKKKEHKKKEMKGEMAPKGDAPMTPPATK